MVEAYIDIDRYYINRLTDYAREDLLSPKSKKEMRQYADIWMEILQEQIEYDRCCTGKCCMKMNGSIYGGLSGLAFLDIYLAKNLAECLFDEENLYVRAAAHLECGLGKLGGCRMSFLAGDAGPLAMAVVLYSDMVANGANVEHMVAKYLMKLLAFKDEAVMPYMHIPCEVMCGRAGYLYSLLYVNKHFPNLIDPDLITDVVVALVRAGKPCQGCDRKHLMYKWRGKELLGAAHGLYGIIYVILLAREYWPRDEKAEPEEEKDPKDPTQLRKLNLEEQIMVMKYMFCPESGGIKICNEYIQDWVLETCHFLTEQIFASGNTLPALGSGSDSLVNWAHGASGAVYTFIEAHKVFKHPNFLNAAVNCAEAIWGRGILKKGYGLSDGVAGNAYALMALYKYTKEEKYKEKAYMFAQYCYNYGARDDPCKRIPDYPLSLWEGLAGVIYMFYDFTTENPKFPGYEL